MAIIGEVKDAAIIGKFMLVTQLITCSWTTGPVLSQEGGSENEVSFWSYVVHWLDPESLLEPPLNVSSSCKRAFSLAGGRHSSLRWE